ncbi:hypothetical protein BJY04DRAFT_218174 [Aspergillus karnatakaensis]|uniref:uncharacterized protein n=1 Tax=Aspergillus karnatakaensis TaxID=1810916 RepID=UPI003CCD9465
MTDPAKNSLFHPINDTHAHPDLNFTSRTINPSSTYNIVPSDSPVPNTQENDNYTALYDDEYNDDDYEEYDYDDIVTDTPATSTADTDGMRVKTTNFTHGEGSTIYDPESGAYDQMVDYQTGEGGYRHHRERMTEDGVYQVRDVERRGDGSRHVHREYDNLGTGTRTIRDFEA